MGGGVEHREGERDPVVRGVVGPAAHRPPVARPRATGRRGRARRCARSRPARAGCSPAGEGTRGYLPGRLRTGSSHTGRPRRRGRRAPPPSGGSAPARWGPGRGAPRGPSGSCCSGRRGAGALVAEEDLPAGPVGRVPPRGGREQPVQPARGVAPGERDPKPPAGGDRRSGDAKHPVGGGGGHPRGVVLHRHGARQAGGVTGRASSANPAPPLTASPRQPRTAAHRAHGWRHSLPSRRMKASASSGPQVPAS